MLNDNDCKKIEIVAEVTVQRFFNHYLNEVFPKQLEAAITAHNKDVTAHAEQISIKVRTEALRIKLWVYGLILAGGITGGYGIGRAIASLFSQ